MAGCPPFMAEVLHGLGSRGIVTGIVQSSSPIWQSVTPDAFAAARPSLLTGMVELWLADLDALQDWADAHAPWLAPTERQRAARITHRVTRAHFETSRVVLRGVLAQHLGMHPCDISLRSAPHGKPELAAEYHDLRCNWSHSRNLFLLAITRGTEVGVDIEAPRSVARAAQLANKVFSSAEIALLQDGINTSAAARDALFLTVWTRKEALLKMHGSGFTVSARDFHVGAEPSGQTGAATVRSVQLPWPGHAAVALETTDPVAVRGFILGSLPGL